MLHHCDLCATPKHYSCCGVLFIRKNVIKVICVIVLLLVSCKRMSSPLYILCLWWFCGGLNLQYMGPCRQIKLWMLRAANRKHFFLWAADFSCIYIYRYYHFIVQCLIEISYHRHSRARSHYSGNGSSSLCIELHFICRAFDKGASTTDLIS